MKKSLLSHLVLLFLVLSYTGCTTQPKPRTVGEKIGQGIDRAITWTVNGFKTLAKNSDRRK